MRQTVQAPGRRLVSGLVALVLASGCGEPMDARGFIARERDFRDYPTWESVTFETTVLEGTEGESGHTGGVRRVYLSARPPEGATEWPVGTRVVKELLDADLIIASAKRGGAYNASGVRGWEWFGLKRDATGAVRIEWRGLGAPLGSEYGSATGTCNACHGSAKELDGVMTPDFRLGR
jgi:hypothetical protein